MLQLDTPIQYLKGVGPKLAALFGMKDIRSLGDALLYVPRDWQDRSQIKKISELRPDEAALVHGQVISHRFVPLRGRRTGMLEAVVDDGSGRLMLKWFAFHRASMDAKLREKPWVLAYGAMKSYGNKPGMVHAEIEWDVELDDMGSSKGILPIYSETEGLHQKTIRKVVDQALELGVDRLVDDLPESLRKSHGLMPLGDAVRALHRPAANTKIEALRSWSTPAQKRLIFDEFFRFEWIVGRRRLSMRREDTHAWTGDGGLLEVLKKKLPFELTGDQTLGIERIWKDLADTRPMNRLLQGDVGCGKTLVAMAAALPVIAGGGQAAFMVPTEILAEQHMKTAQNLLDGLILPNKTMLRAALLTGSTPKAKRDELLAALAAGEIHLLIGTHALIEDPVIFKKLGLVIVDEQHRFGVDQRMRLRAKGIHPHVLSMTATPIPRTLALTAYGDLDVTTIRELPKGRPAIITKIIREAQRDAMYELIRKQLSQGRQAYVIYPLVEESEKIDLANAVQGSEELANGPLAGFRVGLLHGRMKPAEKSTVMDSFKKGDIRVLVSTTVVEVGVDVPNATVLAIEHAERFGLSQLHQLRGRIGRGTHESHCLLVSAGGGETAYERMRAMEETRDGFRLAELDLEIRGPGEFLGTRQSGELGFKYGDLIRDQRILHEARTAAFDLLKTDADLVNPEHSALRSYMERTGHLELKRYETA